MTQQDFAKLSPSLQKEYTLATCSHLFTLSAGNDYFIELYYSENGDFYIELYYKLESQKIILIKSFIDKHHLHKYTMGIDISEVYKILNKNQ